ALGLVHAQHGQDFGLASLLGVSGDSGLGVAYHVVITLAFFSFCLSVGPRLLRAVLRFRYNLLNLTSPIGFELTFMFFLTAICVFLGISAFLGAFAAGLVTSNASDDPARARAAIKNFSFAF